MSHLPKRLSMATAVTMATSTSATHSYDGDDDWTIDLQSPPSAVPDLYLSAIQQAFPYHIVLNQKIQVVQAGEKLMHVLNYINEEDIVGRNADMLFSIRQPEEGTLTWKWLATLTESDVFRLTPTFQTRANVMVRFRASIVAKQSDSLMINMLPDVSSVNDLSHMGLTLQDVPQGHRENIALQEQVASLASSCRSGRRATAKLAEQLTKEKELLESLVPKHVAYGIRTGEHVAPRQHDEATFFFSDVCNFTDTCKQLYPWQVCGLLDRLYCVMDYLLDRFGLFKVETVGDAYVCCSGVPEADEDHAQKVARFAIAVSHCVKHVLSPVDGKPIQLRIGVHTGSCASGVVGVNNPRYCVIGDTVNVTARHESSGEAGRVHLSAVTERILSTKYSGQFKMIPRGLVDMKGKGTLKTFWLESDPSNKFVNKDVLCDLDVETETLLHQTKFDNELERAAQEETTQLVGKLDLASVSEEHRHVFGPVLKMIRQELSHKNSTHTPMADEQTEKDRHKIVSTRKTKSWQPSSASEYQKMMEKHFGNGGLGFIRSSSSEKAARQRFRSLSMSDHVATDKKLSRLLSTNLTSTSYHASMNVEASLPDTSSFIPASDKQGSLTNMVSGGILNARMPQRRRSRRIDRKPSSSPSELFDVIEHDFYEGDL